MKFQILFSSKKRIKCHHLPSMQSVKKLPFLDLFFITIYKTQPVDLIIHVRQFLPFSATGYIGRQYND